VFFGLIVFRSFCIQNHVLISFGVAFSKDPIYTGRLFDSLFHLSVNIKHSFGVSFSSLFSSLKKPVIFPQYFLSPP
jgi:hypothetical protein